MDYYFKPGALEDLRRLSKRIQRQIINKLDFYAKSSYPFKFAKSLKNKSSGEYRYRVGNYRIIFDVEDNKIIILAIGHRKDIYK